MIIMDKEKKWGILNTPLYSIFLFLIVLRGEQ
jgi:hypothetical protein